jgi:hypothetical protein
MSLFKHKEREHTPKNVNEQHKAVQQDAGINQRIAVTLTRAVGTMPCAYLFVCLAIAGFPGLHASLPAYVQWISQTFLQLVFLPVLSVGQTVLSKHQELMAEEQYKFVKGTYSDTEQLIQHLHAQDDQSQGQTRDIQYIARLVEDLQSALLKQTAMIEQARQQQP